MYARIGVACLVIGVALGGTGVYFGPRFVSPHLPESLQERGAGISGPVVAKKLAGDRLLLTVAAKEGAVLVTFRKKLSEIDLLVEEGDTVTLNVKSYRPFLEDPELRAVRKNEPAQRPQPRPLPSLSTPIDSTTISKQQPQVPR